jgi:hypothetical protein
MAAKSGPLDVAFCEGCSKLYTRAEIAARIWPSRRAFSCDCGFEWNGDPYRPITIREMLSGKSAGISNGVDIAVIVRAVSSLVATWKE